MYQYDLYFKNLHKKYGSSLYIVGIDECGRGCLAGPVTASAVILNLDSMLSYVQVYDSKKINANKRNHIYQELKNKVLIKKIASISVNMINKINIANASQLAMLKALLKILKSKIFNKISTFIILIDGNQSILQWVKNSPSLKSILSSCYFYLIPKGDSKSASIAAASIIAKCTRDYKMIHKIHPKYPQYNFYKHKGYPTKEHLYKLKMNNLSNIHRKYFKPCLELNSKNV